jgi:hypothetical protein
MVMVQMAQLMHRRIIAVVVIIQHCIGCTVTNNNFFTCICEVQVGIRKVR